MMTTANYLTDYEQYQIVALEGEKQKIRRAIIAAIADYNDPKYDSPERILRRSLARPKIIECNQKIAEFNDAIREIKRKGAERGKNAERLRDYQRAVRKNARATA